MENYNSPKIEVVETAKEDVITTSLTLPPMPFGSNQDQEHNQ